MRMDTIGVVARCDRDGVNRAVRVNAGTAGGGGAGLPVTRLC